MRHLDLPFLFGVGRVCVQVMCLNYYQIEQNPFMLRLYVDLMSLCTRIYYAECALKLIGLSVTGYFSSAWNRFEFVLVVAAVVEDFFEDVLEAFIPLPPMLLRVLRVARILRILRLLKSYTGLRHVVMTLILSFPSFLNVGALLSLVLFIYATLGVQLFYRVSGGDSLQPDRSFDSLRSATQILIQCLTADDWSFIMVDVSRGLSGPGIDHGRQELAAPPKVHNDAANELQAASPIALAYFISFMVLGLFVLANLVVAVMLQNFSSLGDLNPNLASKDDVEGFSERWNTIDAEGNGFISSEDLSSLLISLERPLRPLGVVPEQQTPTNKRRTRRLVASLVAKGHLPQRFAISAYLDYRFVLVTLVQYSFEHYNRLNIADQIEECANCTGSLFNPCALHARSALHLHETTARSCVRSSQA